MSVHVIIRVDASHQTGTGHVMRCLSLADELKQIGMTVQFICRLLEGNLTKYIEQRGFKVYVIPTKTPLNNNQWEEDAAFTAQIARLIRPYWLIVDHYDIDERWERKLRPYAQKLFIIDDLANRCHEADVLLDQNLAEDIQSKYKKLVPTQCRLLLGPRYLLLRPSFYQERRRLRDRDGSFKRLLIFFGGSDPTGETLKVLNALSKLSLPLLDVDVVIGEANREKNKIKQICSTIKEIQLHIQVENMAELIAHADFALGAGGVSMWERCYLGLPSAVTVVADNQLHAVQLAGEAGAIWNMGWHEQINSRHYTDMINKAAVSFERLMLMSKCALGLLGSENNSSGSQVIQALMEETTYDK